MSNFYNQAIRLPRWLLLVSMVILVFGIFVIGVYVGSKYGLLETGVSTDENEEQDSVGINDTPDESCSELHLTGGTQNIHWKKYAEADVSEASIYYIESNAQLGVICKKKIFTFDTGNYGTYRLGQALPYLHLEFHSTNAYPFVSFFDVYTDELRVVDIATGTIKMSMVPVSQGIGDYRVSYSAPFDNDNEYILVIPKTLGPMGCAGQPGCEENLSNMASEDWAREDVRATIVRTDGMYMGVSRNIFSSSAIQRNVIEVGDSLIIQEWTSDGRKDLTFPLSNLKPINEGE